MNKIRLGIGFLFLWCMLIPLAAAYADSPSQQTVQLYLEGKKIKPDVPPKIVEGRTLVPIRVIAEGLGSDVKWDARAKKVSISSEKVDLSMWIGQKRAVVNGKDVTMDVPPQIDQGRTLLPLRFVGESLGTTVGWESATSSVMVNQPYTLNANGKTLGNEKVFKWNDELYFPLETVSTYIGAVYQSSKDHKADQLIFKDTKVDLAKQGQNQYKLKKLDTGWVIPESILQSEFAVKVTRTEDKVSLIKASETQDVKVSELQAVQVNNGKVIIQATSPMPPKHFLMSGPERLVIDLPNTIIGEQIKDIASFKDGMGIVDKSATVSAASKGGAESASRKSQVKLASDENPLLQQPNPDINPKVDIQDETSSSENQELEITDQVIQDGLELDNAVQEEEPADELIREIRFSQFSLEPQTVRVVIELAQKTNYELNQTDSSIEVTFQPRPKKTGFSIVLDPGHGGSDPGAKGVSGNWEKELTLTVSRLLKEELKNYHGIQVIETRSDDVYPTLQERVQLANEMQADLFLSIHANSFKPETRGTETYYYHEASADFARVLHKHLLEATGFPDRKVKKSGFYVIKNTTMPSSLIEIGFLTNQIDNSQMLDPSFQKRVAKALAEAIYEYYTSLQ